MIDRGRNVPAAPEREGYLARRGPLFGANDAGPAELLPGPVISTPKSTHLLEDLVQRLARDVLHDVIVDVPLVADAEDGHDVGVMQTGRGACLALEPADLLRS